MKKVYQISDEVAFETFNDGGLILKTKNMSITELNLTASDILNFTDGRNDIRQIADLLAVKYEIDVKTAMEDVSELYRRLKKSGYIERV